MFSYPGKIAIVHDWFLSNSFAGAEKVTLSIDNYFTENFTIPDIFSITENISSTNKFNFLKGRTINTTFIQKIPFGKDHVQKFLPIIPFAIEQLDLSMYKLIISSSHLAAKGVLTSPEQLHISYIHTPVRYAWDQMNTYIKRSKLSNIGFEIFIRYFLYKLRRWDYLSGRRADYLIANSNFTSKRIKKYWGLGSKVIHPPVDTERFNFKKERDNFYLCVNRLVPNKRVDLLVKAFNKLKLPLIIVGDGPEKRQLEEISNDNIKLLGNLPNNKVEDLMSKCRAYIYSGVEDFGIAPVEAMASGAPVIAYGYGGLLDSVISIDNCPQNKIATGLLFKNQSMNDIYDAVNWFEDKKLWLNFKAENLNEYAQKFKTSNFYSKFNNFIEMASDEFNKSLI